MFLRRIETGIGSATRRRAGVAHTVERRAANVQQSRQQAIHNALTNPNYSQLYHVSGSTANGAYDKLNQIKSYELGRLNTVSGDARPSQIVPSSSQSWGTNAEGNAQRVMPPDDTRDRPIIQGAYTDSDMMSRVESWSRQVGSNAEPREAMAVRFDAWGNLAKLQGYAVDWWGINRASQTNQSIFSYDAMNRRMAEAHSEAWTRSSTNFYYDLSGHVIEERTWSSKATEMGITVNSSSRSQYLYSPATGQLILRDLDSDNNPATTGTGLPGGIDQRLYALADAQGNITAITNSSGAVVERYFYSPEGKLLITNGQWQTKDASAYDWRYTYQGGRLDGQGLYYVHGGEWDYRTGDPLKHDAMSYWGEHLSYTPPSLSWVDTGVIIGGTVALGVFAGIATGGLATMAGMGMLGSIMGAGFGAGAANSFVSAYSSGKDFGGIATDMAIGGVAGAAGAFVGGSVGLISRSVVMAAGLNCARPILGRVGGALMGAAEGGSMGFTEGFVRGGLSGGWDQAWDQAVSGAEMGLGLGAVFGAVFPQVCFVAGTQVVVGIEQDGDDASAASSLSRETAAVAAAMRVRYATLPIEQLVAQGGGELGDGGGQFVLARDQNDPDGPLELARISRTYQRTAYRLQVLTLRDAEGNEQTLRVTDEHPFYVAGRGWTKARELAGGDVLLGAAGEASAVLSNLGEAHPQGVTVYNLEVQDAHTYFVRGQGSDGEPVWVHNAQYDIIPYGRRAPGSQKHHGVLNEWAEHNVTGYMKRKAPAVELTPAQHDITRSVFAKWRYERTGSVTGPIDWTKVSAREAQALSDRMLAAAEVPGEVQARYYNAFHRYMYTGAF